MIHIVGAGPAGTFTAMNLGKKHDIRIYEEHKKIGEPVECTGLLSPSMSDLIELKKPVVLNKIYSAVIYGPKGNKLEIKFKKPNLVVDRHKFDEFLAKKAEKSGAVLNTGHRFIGYKQGNLLFRSNGKSKKLKAQDILIGADGPLSPVAKAFNIYNNRVLWFGEQYLIKNKDIDQILYYPYYHKTAWAVPQGDGIVRIGAGRVLGQKSNIDAFAKKFKGKRICKQAGIIPLYHPSIQTQTQADNLKVFLVGDAACQMKNTTGGAIIPAMKCAKILAESINSGKDYEKQWRATVGKELNLHYKIRNAFEKFSDHDWNKLLELANKPKVKAILEKTSRDNIKGMIPKLLIAEPRFLMFVKKFI